MITFQPYDERHHAEQLRDWLNTPHVYAWWGRERLPESIGGAGKAAATLDEVHRDFGVGDADTHYYMTLLDGRPIGLTQWCRVDDYAGYPEMLGVVDAVGIDLLIGEEGATGRGIGTRIIRQFTQKVAMPGSGLNVAVADPEEANVASWRAFEKAGYRHIKTFEGERGHVTRLMMFSEEPASSN